MGSARHLLGMDMKASRFTEVRFIGILQEQEAAAKTANAFMSPATVLIPA